jgi:AcrR family transcriptional regulator
MQIFWAQGYDGASLTDLTEAMGINRTSMYAAFGSKQDLFRKVLDRYTAGPAAYGADALARPTAREVALTLLHGAVDTTTTPGRPLGCLSVQGALATAPGDSAAHDLLATWREQMHDQLASRLHQARDEGDLPLAADPDALATYLMTVTNGIAVQAASGRGRDELHRVADMAMGVWPTG